MSVTPKNAKRNAEIVRLRKAGWQPCDIARLLSLTPQTVSGVLLRAGLTNPANNPATPGKPLSDEIRERVASRHRLAWKDPEFRARRLAEIRQVAAWKYRGAYRSEAA